VHADPVQLGVEIVWLNTWLGFAPARYQKYFVAPLACCHVNTGWLVETEPDGEDNTAAAGRP